MKTYLCGGINGLNDADCRDWREVAKTLLKTETLDPMRRDYRGRERECATEIVEKDIEDIKASDFLLVNATRPSWGTAMEIAYAHQLGKPCVAFVDPGQSISPWLSYHCKHIVQSLPVACASINAEVR